MIGTLFTEIVHKQHPFYCIRECSVSQSEKTEPDSFEQKICYCKLKHEHEMHESCYICGGAFYCKLIDYGFLYKPHKPYLRSESICFLCYTAIHNQSFQIDFNYSYLGICSDTKNINSTKGDYVPAHFENTPEGLYLRENSLDSDEDHYGWECYKMHY